MNPAKITLQNRTTAVILSLIVMVAGVAAYTRLGRLEFPDFVIKTALIVTPYPGASAEQVEQEVTDTLEEAIQSLGELHEIKSISQQGLSVIYAEIKDEYYGAELQQIWDKLRRKVNDIAGSLPPGAGPPVVNDDFGDVYGLFYAISGDVYSFAELKDYADDLKKHLLLCEDVAKISFWGVQPEVVYVEISRTRMAELGISPQMIVGVIRSQDVVQPSGNVMVGEDYVRIEPTGELKSEQLIGELLIPAPVTGRSIRLRDIAEVRRGYLDPPRQVMRFNGRPSIGMGISTVAGGNAVTMANAVKQRLLELDALRPAGMNLEIIYDQGGSVDKAVNEFVLNLAESVAIVVGLLLLFMGWRSGLLIGIVLMLTILATFIYMDLVGITLQKISLGALILALGMLVDNAIVVVEGVLIKCSRGEQREAAAISTVQQVQWPLLGATFIGALAFAAIGFAPGNIGEFCRSLFWVLGISLLFSWVTAVTVTPLLCIWMLKTPSGETVDPYDTPFFRVYRRGLHVALRLWPVTLAVIASSVVAAVMVFAYVPQFFFPESSQPLFTVELFHPEGVHISKTSESMKRIESAVGQQGGVKSVATFVGQGALRFLLTYSPKDPNAAFGQLLVTVEDLAKMDVVMQNVSQFLADEFPDAEWIVARWKDGPPYDYAIEARFRGPDENVLRDLADQAKEIMRTFPTKNVRDSWRNRVPVLRPTFSEVAARKAGLTRSDVANVLRLNYGGQPVGIYREENDLLPIIVQPPAGEKDDYRDARRISAWSEVSHQPVPLDVVISDWSGEATWENPIIRRRHREREIEAQCNPAFGLAMPIFNQMKPKLEAIDLPFGYTLDWGGEYEASAEGTEPLAVMFPICLFGMFVILIALFKAIRQPMIIFACLPLVSVGVTAALLLTQIPFGFMAILGYLGLSGMLIKNAIVLIDEIDLNRSNGVAPYPAVLNAAVSRLRPVTMASGTTVLGMLPLLWDPFYQAMGATVAGGLIGSTVLVLLVVPLFYVLAFRIKPILLE